MKHIYITRDLFFDQQASLGTCYIFDGVNQLFKSESLERGWINNKNSVSCIPEGTYDVVLEYSPKFKKLLWEIKGVPNRSECKFHVSNYWWQLNGCIALGKNRKFIDSDAVMDITSSGNTMDAFHKALEGDTVAKLHIYNVLNL